MKTFVFAAGLTLAFTAPGLFASPPASTTSSVAFSKNPANVGDPVNVTASVASGTTVVGGTIVLRSWQDGSGNPVSCAVSTGTWVTIASGDPSSISGAAYTALPGSYGYSAHYVPDQAHGDFHESKSPCMDLVVGGTGICSGGFVIAATQGSGTDLPTAGTTWTGSFIITVSNCSPDALSGASAQGGSSAWTNVLSYMDDIGSTGVRKQTGGGNQILLWTIGSMTPGKVGNLTVNLSGKIKAGTSSGTQLNINGGWSAHATDTVTNSSVSSGYTSPIIISVQ